MEYETRYKAEQMGGCFVFVHSVAMTDEQKARLSTKRPLTKEEYEAKQSVIRRVVDPETGRTRYTNAIYNCVPMASMVR